MDSVQQATQRLYDHLLPAILHVAASIPVSKREETIVVIADTADEKAASVVRLILANHPAKPADMEEQLGATSFYGACSREKLRQYLASLSIQWLPRLDVPLPPGKVRLVSFVLDGYYATTFEPLAAGLGLA